MKIKMYCVYDAKLGAFMLPQFYATPGVAERAFQKAVNTPDTQFCESPQDFTLFEIGVYEDENASVVMHTAPVEIVKALQLKSSKSTVSEE